MSEGAGARPDKPQDDLYAAFRARKLSEPVDDEFDFDGEMERWRRSGLNRALVQHGSVIPDWARRYFEDRREHQGTEPLVVLNVIEGFELIISYQVGTRPTSRMYVRRQWAKAHDAREEKGRK